MRDRERARERELVFASHVRVHTSVTACEDGVPKRVCCVRVPVSVCVCHVCVCFRRFVCLFFVCLFFCCFFFR